MSLPNNSPQAHGVGRNQRRMEESSATQTQYPSSTRPEYASRTSYHSAQYQHAGTSTTNGTSTPISSFTSLPSSNSLTHLNVAQHTLNAGKSNSPPVAYNRPTEDFDALKATLRGLAVELPDHMVARIAGRCTEATTMERFLVEESSWVPNYGTKGVNTRKG